MPRIGETSEVFKCNFCTKSQKQVKRLIAGDGVYICDECIGLCNEIIEEEFPRVETFGLQTRLRKLLRSLSTTTTSASHQSRPELAARVRMMMPSR